MYARGRIAETLREACIATGLTFCLGLAQAAGDLRIHASDDVITIKADETSTRHVLEELSRQTSLVVVSQAALDQLVSVEINEPTLATAIRRLLRHRNFLLQQSGDLEGSLWIFSNDAGNGQQAWATPGKTRPSLEHDNDFSSYLILMSSLDASDRREAMFGFGEVADEDSIEYLRMGLSDPDEGVRGEAIQSLAELGGNESVEALGFALSDREARVRVDAVEALGEIGGPEAVKLLRQATTDGNDTVREAATEWLTELAW